MGKVVETLEKKILQGDYSWEKKFEKAQRQEKLRHKKETP